MRRACFLIPFFFLFTLGFAQQDAAFNLPEVRFINATFLGNENRTYYGSDAPDELELIWKQFLGKGITVISRSLGEKEWMGAGWTGQPLMVEEEGELYLIQGAFDHHLKKIRARDGELIWQYAFDDVVKGTGSLWRHPDPRSAEEAVLILQGSRLGTHHFLDAKYIPSYRAISLLNGKEQWRLDVKYTGSYSRDVDASALVYDDLAYIGLENSLFTVLDPRPEKAEIRDGMKQPLVLEEHRLYEMDDLKKHRNNIVTEGSPCRIGDHIYIPSGSGWVWGYNLKSRNLDWRFYVGSDMDGSAVATPDSCLLISVEKQYIRGEGGILKLDPRKTGTEAVCWFFPTGSVEFAGWQGGVIGSAAVSAEHFSGLNLVAFTAIDGHFYVVDLQETGPEKTLGPDSLTRYPKPRMHYKAKTGESIATPLFVEDKLLVPGYGGLWLYQYDEQGNFQLLDRFNAIFEATPFVYEKKIYIASRDGYLYCLGNPEP